MDYKLWVRAIGLGGFILWLGLLLFASHFVFCSQLQGIGIVVYKSKKGNGVTIVFNGAKKMSYWRHKLTSTLFLTIGKIATRNSLSITIHMCADLTMILSCCFPSKRRR